LRNKITGLAVLFGHLLKHNGLFGISVKPKFDSFGKILHFCTFFQNYFKTFYKQKFY